MESYGHVDSATSLKKEFYRRDQGAKESFEDYSLALVKIADRIVQRHGREDGTINKELKERLTEGVIDNHFRRELRRLNLDEPDLTFWSFRTRATTWLGDDRRITVVHEVSHTPTLEEKMRNSRFRLTVSRRSLICSSEHRRNTPSVTTVGETRKVYRCVMAVDHLTTWSGSVQPGNLQIRRNEVDNRNRRKVPQA